MTSTEGSSEKKNKWKNETTGKKVLRNHFSSPGTFPAWQKRWKTVSLFSFCFESWAKVFPGHFFFLRCFLSSGNLIRFSHTLFECWFKRSSTEKSKKKKAWKCPLSLSFQLSDFFSLMKLLWWYFIVPFFCFQEFIRQLDGRTFLSGELMVILLEMKKMEERSKHKELPNDNYVPAKLAN